MLLQMLSSLAVTAIRDKLFRLVHEDARRELTLRVTLVSPWRCFAAAPPSPRWQDHLVIVLGSEAICEGYCAVRIGAGPGGRTGQGHGEVRLDERLAFYAKPRLLLIDESGYVFDPNAAHLLFQHLSRRYELGGLLITPTARSASGRRILRSSSPPSTSTRGAITAMSSASVAIAQVNHLGGDTWGARWPTCAGGAG